MVQFRLISDEKHSSSNSHMALLNVLISYKSISEESMKFLQEDDYYNLDRYNIFSKIN